MARKLFAVSHGKQRCEGRNRANDGEVSEREHAQAGWHGGVFPALEHGSQSPSHAESG